MKYVVKPFPVLYACAGCREYGYAAPRVAQRLDEQGLVHAVWLGEVPQPHLARRFPIFTVEACERNCARDWVERQGGQVERTIVLDPLDRVDPERAAARIAATL